VPLQLATLRPPPRLYRLLPLMPAVFSAYLIVMLILLFVFHSIQLFDVFKVLFFTLLFVLIAFNLGLILQYGFTLSKLTGDTTTPKLLLAFLATTYTIVLVLVIAAFFTERRAETAFTVIRLTALVGAIPVAIAVIASRSSALIAIATLASLTAITLLAIAVLTGLASMGLLQKLTSITGLNVAGLVSLALLTTLQFITLHSLLNQPFGFTIFFIIFISESLYEVLGSVAFESRSELLTTFTLSTLFAFTYIPGILSITTLSWLAYRAYKATGNVGFKRVALILMLEVVVSFILLPQVSIPAALWALVAITRRPGVEDGGFGGFIFLLAMATLLLTIVQTVKWNIAIRPLEDSQAATHSSPTLSRLGESTLGAGTPTLKARVARELKIIKL